MKLIYIVLQKFEKTIADIHLKLHFIPTLQVLIDVINHFNTYVLRKHKLENYISANKL